MDKKHYLKICSLMGAVNGEALPDDVEIEFRTYSDVELRFRLKVEAEKGKKE